MENLRTWKEWSKYNTNGWFHKLLVLFGLRHSPTYEMHKALEPMRQFARDMHMQRTWTVTDLWKDGSHENHS